MEKRSRKIATVSTLAFMTGSILLYGGQPGLGADEFNVVTDFDAFKAHFVGPKIMDPENADNFFIVKEDGTIEGTWHGATMAGEWRWEDAYFCRSLSAPRAAPEDCQEWAYGDGKARLVRDRGAGQVTIYALGE